MLVTKPVSKAHDFSEPFVLCVDASDVGIVLMQEDKNGMLRPVSYFSKRLNRHQERYSVVEKEALALLLALRHYDVYIKDSPFTTKIQTDHNPLVFVQRMKNHNRRLLNWSLALQDLNIHISHIKGKDNVIADCLSR